MNIFLECFEDFVFDRKKRFFTDKENSSNKKYNKSLENDKFIYCYLTFSDSLLEEPIRMSIKYIKSQRVVRFER